MAIVTIPKDTLTQIHTGGADAVAFSNPVGYAIALSPTDPSTAGAVVSLKNGDAVWFADGSKEAASDWFARCPIDTRIVVETFV